MLTCISSVASLRRFRSVSLAYWVLLWRRPFRAAHGTRISFHNLPPLILNSSIHKISPQQNFNQTIRYRKIYAFGENNMLMNYLANYPNRILRYHTSNMITNIESNLSYLLLSKSCSHAGAWLIFVNNTSKVPKLTTNTSFQVMCTTINNATSSMFEAETCGIYMGFQQECPIRTAAI